MNLVDVQPAVSSQIMAVADLASFGQPIEYSLSLDDESVRDQIAAGLRDKGVVIEIGALSGADANNASTPGRFAVVDTSFEVFVAENPKTTHAPANTELVSNVIAAVTKQADRHETPIRWTGYEAAKNDHGYVLHVLSFTVPVRIS